MRDARDSGRPHPAEGGHRLSMVHKTSNPETVASADSGLSPSMLFQVWKDASLAIFPGIPNLNPVADFNTGKVGGIRGKVYTLTDASRRNLMLYLAKLNRDAKGFTMTLTLPGDLQFITSARVHLSFKKLCNRLTASRIFPSVGFVWKRELQQRGALHYHLLIYGVEDQNTRNAFQTWISKHWNALVCVGLSEEETAKHHRWHLHRKNMEAVRGNIARYFAKYLGMPLEAVYELIPGRWWGKVNGNKALPVCACSSLTLPSRAAVIAHRLARKLLKKRADEAKHRAVAKTANLIGLDGQPLISQFGLIRVRNQVRKLDLAHFDRERCPPGTMLDLVIFTAPSFHGLKWGKSQPRGFAKYSKVRLISKNSPSVALQIQNT